MLSQLYIENIAVIQKATINLTEGLNVFTGETGAGKTILISAISAVLGGRTSRDIIRSGEQKALVSAVFSEIVPEVQQQLADLGYQTEDGQLMISRELDAEGKGSSRISGRPATVAVLRQVAELLIDIHGQNDSRELMESQRHIGFIDGFGELSGQLAQYRLCYDELCAVREQLETLTLDESYKQKRQEILQYQIDEIAAAELTAGEQEELTAQRDLIRNAEKITEALGAIYNILSGNEEQEGMLDGVSELEDALATAGRYLGELESYGQRVNEMKYDLQELSSTARSLLDDSDFNPRQLDSIETRLDLLHRLEKKYGATVEEVLGYYQKICEELDGLAFSEEKADKLRIQLEQLTAQAQEQADKLTVARLEAGERFVSLVEGELVYLDMPNVRLSLWATKHPLGSSGQDSIEFYISANLGEPPKSLSKIAS
ncbi:MAG: AAA family ATPase, partial [Angelakisella sp.]